MNVKIKNKLKKYKFVDTHCHDEYSIRDAMGKVEDMAELAKERDLPALAITNHGSVGGFLRQYYACKSVNIKPIFGCEIYTNKFRSETSKDILKKNRENNHLILLAKNKIGFKNLLQITSDAWINGFYYRPRSDMKFIKKYSKGIIATSACIKGIIPQCLLNGEEKRAAKIIKKFKEIFDDFYIELNMIDWEPQFKLNSKLIEIAKYTNTKTILTGDVHYLKEEHTMMHDILILLSNNNTLSDLRDKSKKVFQYDVKDLFYKTPEDLYEIFEAQHRSLSFTDKVFFSSLRNSHEMVSSISNIKIDNKLKLPSFDKDADKIMKKEILAGFKRLKIKKKTNPEYFKRARFEYDIICKKGFADYFLIVQDFINYAKSKDIYVGPGRGSAAGSLISYLMGITSINPIKYGLLFERFISIERKDIPDIDVDFEPEFRDDVKKYIVEKYGANKTCTIGSYGTYQVRSALLDLARVHNVPLRETMDVSKFLPVNKELEDLSFSDIKKEFGAKKGEDKNIIDIYWKKYPEVIERCELFYKQIKNVSKHAAGIVISSENIYNSLALMSADKQTISAWQEGGAHKELSKIGFVKFDILGLNNLTVMKKCLNLIKKNKGIDIDLNNIDMNDKKALRLANTGDTLGIFQFESKTAISWLKKIGVDNFMDLSSITSVMRPGVSDTDMAGEFIKRKRGEIEYKIPKKIKYILKETFGIIIYQEQIMLIAQKIGGFDKSESNYLREILVGKGYTKEDQAEAILKCRKKFISNAKKHIKKDAKKLWMQMVAFAKYGFNKSHAVSYSYIGYLQLWLKANYFLEFMISLLNNTSRGKKNSNEDNVMSVYIKYLKGKGYTITVPDINKSEAEFSIYKKSILFGFSHIKGVGNSANIIIENQPYESLANFCEKVKGKKVSKTKVEALIYSGAFDKFGDRDKLVNEYNTKININKKYEPVKFSKIDIIRKEVEMINNCISQKFFSDEVLEKIKKKKIDLPSKLNKNNKIASKKTIGLLSKIVEKTTRNKNKYYSLVFTDDSDSISVNIFNESDIYWVDMNLKVNNFYSLKNLSKHIESGKWNVDRPTEDNIKKLKIKL